MRELRLQSAMEYMVTYGWAIIMVAIALASLYLYGVFSSNNNVPNTCSFPGQFACTTTQLSYDGNLIINVGQTTLSNIDITAVGCNFNGSTAHMALLGEPIMVQTGNYTTLSMQCYKGNSVFTGGAGTVFYGYVTINYTDLHSGLPHTVTGSITEKPSGIFSSSVVTSTSMSTTSSTSSSSTSTSGTSSSTVSVSQSTFWTCPTYEAECLDNGAYCDGYTCAQAEAECSMGGACIQETGCSGPTYSRCIPSSHSPGTGCYIDNSGC